MGRLNGPCPTDTGGAIRAVPDIRCEPKLRRRGSGGHPTTPKLCNPSAIVKERRYASVRLGLGATFIARGSSGLHTSSWALRSADAPPPDLDTWRSPDRRLETVEGSGDVRHARLTRHLAGTRTRRRLALQRWRSNGCPLRMTANRRGTSLRATAHTALVRWPPLRARSAS